MGSLLSLPNQQNYRASADRYGIFNQAIASAGQPPKNSQNETRFLTYNNLIDRPVGEEGISLNA